MTKERKPTTLRDMAAGLFVQAPPKKKTYSQIVSKFNETRVELQELVADSEAAIIQIEDDIKELEVEKSEVVEEKSNALTTLDFLDKFVQG